MARRAPKQRTGAADAGPGGGACAGISVAGHPRTSLAVRRAKGWGGLLGLALGTWLAWSAHLPAQDALLRGLLAGIGGYVTLWAIAVAVARQLVVAEVRARHAELTARAAAATAPDA